MAADIDVHSRDIVDSSSRESILNAKEFAWESQLRFSGTGTSTHCVLKQRTGFFRYGRVNMGVNGRLVITPLTDRCYGDHHAGTHLQAREVRPPSGRHRKDGNGKGPRQKAWLLPCFVINCGEGLDQASWARSFRDSCRSVLGAVLIVQPHQHRGVVRRFGAATIHPKRVDL